MSHAHPATQMISIDLPDPKRESLAALTNAELIERFDIGVERFDARVFDLADSELDTAFRPESNIGRWPIRVLLGHLADAELSFVHRMRKVVAEDGPTLGAWDEDAFIDAGLYGTPETGPSLPIGASVATVHTLRKWTTPWLKTLADAAFQRVGLHTVRGEMTMRTILEYDVWHLEHHAWFLNKKVAKFRR